MSEHVEVGLGVLGTPGLHPGPEPGQVLLPVCDSCGFAHWYPKPSCPSCSASWSWRAVDGSGKVFTFSIVRRPFSPELAERLPLLVATVALDAHPHVRLVTNMVDCSSDDVRIGMAVTPELRSASDGADRLNYRPTPANPRSSDVGYEGRRD
jgi:uncharacterized OB-fold protein